MSDSPASVPLRIRVEVVYADASGAITRGAVVAGDATVGEAIAASGIRALLPAEFESAAFGIHGRLVDADASLRDGDRIELYRPLKIDPKQARRRRAETQQRRK